MAGLEIKLGNDKSNIYYSKSNIGNENLKYIEKRCVQGTIHNKGHNVVRKFKMITPHSILSYRGYSFF